MCVPRGWPIDSMGRILYDGCTMPTQLEAVRFARNALIVRLYAQEGVPVKALAENFHLATGFVYRIIQRAYTPLPARKAAPKPRNSTSRIDAEWTKKQFFGERRSVVSIAAELKCSTKTVRRKLGRITQAPPRIDIDWTSEQFFVKRRSAQAIADELGCSVRKVRDFLRSRSLLVTGGSAGSNRSPGSIQRRLFLPDAEIVKLYAEDGLNIPALCRQFGVSRSTIVLRLKDAGIRAPTRSS